MQPAKDLFAFQFHHEEQAKKGRWVDALYYFICTKGCGCKALGQTWNWRKSWRADDAQEEN